MLNSVVCQQGFLILDALGLGLVLVLVLLAQTCIDRAKNVPRLLAEKLQRFKTHRCFEALHFSGAGILNKFLRFDCSCVIIAVSSYAFEEV